MNLRSDSVEWKVAATVHFGELLNDLLGLLERPPGLSLWMTGEWQSTNQLFLSCSKCVTLVLASISHFTSSGGKQFCNDVYILLSIKFSSFQHRLLYNNMNEFFSAMRGNWTTRILKYLCFRRNFHGKLLFLSTHFIPLSKASRCLLHVT